MMSMLAAVATLLLATRGEAKAVNFRGSGRVSRPEATALLEAELASSPAAAARLAAYEDGLRQMYVSLPKNTHGNLGHQTVRYALHRFFVNRYAWYINGLELAASSNTSALPNIIQSAFESRTGELGVSLRGLAILAASLEDLAEKEMRDRLKDSYLASDVPSDVPVAFPSASDALETFLISFLISNNWTVTDRSDLNWKKNLFHSKYRDYNGTMAWYTPIRDRHLGKDATSSLAFEAVANASYEIGRTYHSYNDRDCGSLRSTLNALEGKKPGRVRLSVFYNMSLYSHWAFNERIEFLRDMGLLDESDPKQTSIIIANYALSRQNCLNGTSLYAICCRNACDELTSSLERDIQAPVASVERIVELVSKMPSASVAAPRAVTASLRARLEEIAAHHSGGVPLHGRLFTQWMHHAYPLECPYPHESGVQTSQTPEAWLAQTGHASSEASPEEMRRHVEADTCVIGGDGRVECGVESTDLPWSMAEELLAGDDDEASSDWRLLALALGLLFAAVLMVWPLWPAEGAASGGRRRYQSVLSRSSNKQNCFLVVALLLVASACCADLLDHLVFGMALVGSCFMVVARFVAARFNAVAACSGLPTRQVKTV